MSETDLRSAAAHNRRMAAIEDRMIHGTRGKRRAEATRRDLWLQLAQEIDDYLQGQQTLDDQDALL